ncbi:MAG TPA: hypothetical protein ENI95_08520 [Chloroflexi bacterium]|nr:hypothetical protein [Chloroflexota bacterium]
MGLPELIILALLAFVVIGPERSQDVALQAGRFLKQLMTSSWWKDFTMITRSIRDLPTTLVRMAELEEAQAELRRTVQEIEEGVQIDLTAELRPLSTDPDRKIPDPWGIRSAGVSTPPASGPAPSDDAAASPSPPVEDDDLPVD